jgi:hypothetical protein
MVFRGWVLRLSPAPVRVGPTNFRKGLPLLVPNLAGPIPHLETSPSSRNNTIPRTPLATFFSFCRFLVGLLSEMCQKIHAIFRCAAFHERHSEPKERFKHIKDCAAFQQGIDCKEWRTVHEPDEDEHNQYCPECLGLRPGGRVGAVQPYDKRGDLRPESQHVASRLESE